MVNNISECGCRLHSQRKETCQDPTQTASGGKSRKQEATPHVSRTGTE